MRDIDPNVLIILGRPGAGKTTLMRRMVFHPVMRVFRFKDLEGDPIEIDWTDVGVVGYDNVNLQDPGYREWVRKWQQDAKAKNARIIISVEAREELEMVEKCLEDPPLVLAKDSPEATGSFIYKGTIMTRSRIGATLH